jgi:hypothetical protein
VVCLGVTTQADRLKVFRLKCSEPRLQLKHLSSYISFNQIHETDRPNQRSQTNQTYRTDQMGESSGVIDFAPRGLTRSESCSRFIHARPDLPAFLDLRFGIYSRS